ncbi:AT-rich interactive domain-containing protein 2 isoform X11 [Vanessa atalanta]|uniref:AT-rich interactive domain-containing protein 2 isoform X11 n=1 Tax=Vanessa atalanta TaxID=42275 RepID=UPI001FCDCDF3|nr:AT-rich interactive domain-containing protein 2 isoform X11 [Vanessa atalanta]
MAKSQINTKSRDYLRDKEVFLKELKQFNESKNIPYKIPVVNGVDIDLYLLYSLVLQRGGLSKVNQNDTWESFLRQLRLPHPCVNGSTLLRRIYGTYLEKYERAKGPPGRDDDNDLDEDPRRGRGGGMPRISFGSGTYISASGEPLRTGNRVAGPSERLTLSLLSPMPNEQDFAVNVCTVLAADHSNRLPLSTTHHILDFLLAHAGVYNHSSLRDTIGRSYYEARGRYPHEFWQLRAGGGGAKELADETKFMQPGLEQPELMVQALAAHNTLTDCLMQGGEEEDSLEKIIEDDIHEDWVTEPSEEDQLFAPELTGGAGCVYTQRVLQIASIVRSLSFHEENVQYLARNTTLIRFLLLCANCWVGTLRQSGLDTLGNVSTELIIKDPATCLISRHVLSTIQSALVSQDRARVLAALELLNKLAQNEANEEALLKALEAKVYSDVCALLSLRDIMVLVCTLECVYALTSLGDRACEAVARVPGLAHTLVALVTVEAQSYGPRACILMRVVETVSGPGALAAGEAERAPQVPQSQPAKPTEPPQTSASPAPAPAAPAPSPAPVAMSSLQQSHLQQRTVQENEHFAQAWLRATYEPLPGSDNSACDAAELYRQYLACCTKLARKGVIAPAHFPRLVRTVFGGTVGPNTITTASGETQHVYIGIRAKNLPNRNNPPVGPSSPILKAQLTNKTAVVETKPPVVQTQTPAAPAHPQLSQALEGASNTSLIKHLLAHKVSPPAHAHAQVAQRQQSQQRVVPATAGTVVVQPNQSSSMEVDPEALIKCTTIIPGGVANNTTQAEKMVLNAGEEVIVQKDEPVQIQIDDQLTIMIQPSVIQAVKTDKDQIVETVVTDHSYTEPPAKKLKVEEKPENNSPQESVSKTAANLYAALAASALEDEDDLLPPKQDAEVIPSVLVAGSSDSQSVIIQEPILQVQQPTMQVQQPTIQVQQPMQVQQPTLQMQASTIQVQQPTLQVQQPMLQVQPMDVQNIIASQSGQLILQEKPVTSQTTQFMQQPMQIIATPGTSQAGLSYIAQNIPGNMMQKTIIIVQGPTGGGPLTLTVNNPAGLDEATLNTLIAQATEAITQQQIIQNSGVIQSTQRVIVSQPALVSTSQPIAVVKTTITQNAPQITPSQQPIITTQPQPHKAQLVNQAPTQQIVVTQKQPPALISTSSGNPIVGTNQIIQGNQQLLQGNQQIIAVSNNQQIIVNTPMKQGVVQHRVVQQPQRSQITTVAISNNQTSTTMSESKTVPIQGGTKSQQPIIRQVITRQPVMMGNTKIGDKEVLVTQPVAEKQAVPKKTVTPPPQPLPPGAEDTPWICHWRGCGKSFGGAGAVFAHAARAHCPAGAGGEAACQWLDCDRVPRRTFALLNHLTDKHCTPQALKAVYNSRRHTVAESEASKPVSLGYPPNAALAALNKHATDMFNPRELMHRADVSRTPDLMDENEGPVTKSIRLTAALILRNIVIYSNTGRRLLRSYEAHLASIALSNVEASRTIAQVLYDMNNI